MAGGDWAAPRVSWDAVLAMTPDLQSIGVT